MDAVAAASASNNDPPVSHRQSILGSFLRGRPRGLSQSQPQPQPPSPFAQINTNPADWQQQTGPISAGMGPPSPGPGHRRRPAGAIQASASHNFPTSASNPVSGFSQILRRRRSANGALPTNSNSSANPASNGREVAALRAAEAVGGGRPTGPAHRIRFVPHLDTNRSLHFDPMMRDVREGDTPLRIGRFTDRSGNPAMNAAGSHKLAFKSKVVSRGHAEVWVENGGVFFIKDTKSSSGTFLNHVRLSPAGQESRPFQIKDGDILQLGVDYQGGAEDIYKCVKMKIEIGREWQAGPNAFNKNALKQLRALSTATTQVHSPGSKAGFSDCCICLFAVTVHQSLFISPCSHVFHYKCIRPLLNMHHPGFSCPLCRTFANLEEDVEVDVDPGMRLDDNDDDGEMDVDGAVAAVTNAKAILGATNDAAEANAGAETESEREPGFSPIRSRVTSTRPGILTNPIPVEDQDDDDDDNVIDEADWPPLAVPVPAATVVGGQGPYVGPPISRPMSAPVRNLMAPSLSAPLSGPAASPEHDSFPPRNRSLNYNASNVIMHSNTSMVDDMYDDADPSASGSGSGGEADADMHADFSSGEGISAEDRERTVGEKRKR